MAEPIISTKILLSDPQEDFLKKEADKLNSEVEALLEETRTREKYSLAIIAGVAVWIVSNVNSLDIRLLQAISVVPFITTLIYGISVWCLYKNIQWIGDYLLKIENYFFETSTDGSGNTWGWEKYFNAENKKSRFVKITIGSWILQGLLAVALFVLVSNKDKLLIPQKTDKNANTQHAVWRSSVPAPLGKNDAI